MELFSNEDGSLERINKTVGPKATTSEQVIEKMISNSLGHVFSGLELIKTQYSVDDLRIDAVAFSNDSKSFVIIEYKNIKNCGIIDQGMSYLLLLKEKPMEFYKLYTDSINSNDKPALNDINWDDPKVIFIAPEFTKHQIRANKSMELPIEMYEISFFENGEGKELISLNRVGAEQSKEESKTVQQKWTTYTIEGYLNGEYDEKKSSRDEHIKDIYHKLIDRILKEFNGLKFTQKKIYGKIESLDNGSIVCTVVALAGGLNLTYNVVTGVMPENDPFIKDMSGKAHHGLGDYMSNIKSGEDIETAMRYIKKAYLNKVGHQISLIDNIGISDHVSKTQMNG